MSQQNSSSVVDNATAYYRFGNKFALSSATGRPHGLLFASWSLRFASGDAFFRLVGATLTSATFGAFVFAFGPFVSKSQEAIHQNWWNRLVDEIAPGIFYMTATNVLEAAMAAYLLRSDISNDWLRSERTKRSMHQL
jgi:hypothetical protein